MSQQPALPAWCLPTIPERVRLQALRRTPGMAPLDWADWLWVDAAYGAQMRLREALLAEQPEAVLLMSPEAEPAAAELCAKVVTHLTAGRFAGPGQFVRQGDWLQCPDGRAVDLTGPPMAVIGRLVQADFCLLTGAGAAAKLTGAVLCFPAQWRLAEKAGHGLSPIHAPIQAYDEDLSRRVNRLFDALHPDRPLWRANLLRFVDPALFQPEIRRNEPRDTGDFWRSERQTLIRLPQSQAVAFGIHTMVAPL